MSRILPSAAKNVSVGNAARNGLFAALLAQQGYEAAPRAIEGPLGWARTMGDEPDLARMLDGLGKTWEIREEHLQALSRRHRVPFGHRRVS